MPKKTPINYQLQNAQQRKYDIQNRFNILIQDLRMRNPGLELQEVQNAIASIILTESGKFTYLDQQIPDLKASANGILSGSAKE